MKRTYGIYGIILLSLLAGIWLLYAQGLPSGEPQIPQMPGSIEDTGTHFEITDSEYLNIALDSTAEIQLRLESIPRVVILHMKSASGAASTCITLGEFPASTIFYKYEDDYHNLELFTTDASGRYTYEQDISTPHLVFIQPERSTIYLTDAGWSVPSVGTWDSDTMTATLTQDLAETIQIESDGITLDGGGHTITGTGLLSGVYLLGRTGVTIRNLTVREFQCGIFLNISANNFIEDSNVISNFYGIRLYNLSNSNVVTGNTASSNDYGIHLFVCSSNQIYNNNFIDNTTQAYVESGSDNLFNLAMSLGGGNYWSDWTGPDDDGDGFVDSAYVFDYGQQDGLPWVNQDGWGNVPPIAEAGPDQTVILGESVQFDGSGSSDPDGTIVSYQWESGNPTSTGSDMVFIHTYSMEGIYTVTLTVTDNDGATGTDTAIVTVLTPAAAINDVIGVIEDMNLGNDNSLSAKLEGAQDALNSKNTEQYNDVINKLEAFINTVESQRGKKLTDEQADELVEYATRIILALSGGSAAPSVMSPLPQTACLLLAYPMPSNPDVWIPYQLRADSNVVIRIHDLSGHLIRTFDLGYRPAGHYTSKDKAAYWDGRNEIGEEVASGIYFYTLQSGDFSSTKKMIISR
jgi:parallel beta-helix repeat protein